MKETDLARLEKEYEDKTKRKTMVEYVHSLIMERGGPQVFSV